MNNKHVEIIERDSPEFIAVGDWFDDVIIPLFGSATAFGRHFKTNNHISAYNSSRLMFQKAVARMAAAGVKVGIVIDKKLAQRFREDLLERSLIEVTRLRNADSIHRDAIAEKDAEIARLTDMVVKMRERLQDRYPKNETGGDRFLYALLNNPNDLDSSGEEE